MKGLKILNKRQFCSYSKKNESFIVEQNFVNNNLSNESVNKYENEKTLTPKTDKKLIVSKSPSIIDKLESLKAGIDCCYTKITKSFLVDPEFLRFVYHNIKNKEGNLTYTDSNDETLDSISLK